MGFVGGSEHFTLVNVVHAQLFENLGFREVADAAFRHHRDGNGGHDLADFLGRGHARDAAFGTNLCGHALKRHDRNRAGLFGDDGLFGCGDVHNYAALEHFGEAGLKAKAGGATVVLGHN